MPRYIDLDKALAILENSLNYSKTQLGNTNEEYKKGCIAAIKDDIGNVSHMPTEDVVPRSEVEQLKVEFEAMRGAANSYKMHYEQAKQEVAREIFNEVELAMLVCKVFRDRTEYYEFDLKESIAELEKKYIGEKK